MDEKETDSVYYRRRAAEELAKSRDDLDPALAAKHRQLSSTYTSRALQAERKFDLQGPLEQGAGDESSRSVADDVAGSRGPQRD